MSTLRNTDRRSSWTRHIARVGTALGIAALVGGMAACSDVPAAPLASGEPVFELTSRPQANLIADLASPVNTLTWTKAVKQETAGKLIGPEGGSFGLASGVKVIVPPGAVQTRTAFSITRLGGIIVAYDFQPHGTSFAVPVQIEHPTRELNLLPLSQAAWVEGAYFTGSSALDQTARTATVSEFRPTFVSADKKIVKFTVDHFSGYTVAWGRTRPTEPGLNKKAAEEKLPHGVSLKQVGDTTVTTFTLKPDARRVIVPLGAGHQLVFGAGAASVCDPATAGYGVKTWNRPCAPLTQPITFTARSWTTADGTLPRVQFDKDVRFVPGTEVTLALRNPRTRFPADGATIWHCPTGSATCVDEASLDATLQTRQDLATGAWTRRLQHFSGYTVVVNRSRR